MIDVQRNGGAVGKAVPEGVQAIRHGSSETEDTLVIISDHGQVVVVFRESQEHQLLQVGYVLIFVDHQVTNARADIVGDALVSQNIVGPEEEMAEVDAVACSQRPLVPQVAVTERAVKLVAGIEEAPGGDILLGDTVEKSGRIAYNL